MRPTSITALLLACLTAPSVAQQAPPPGGSSGQKQQSPTQPSQTQQTPAQQGAEARQTEFKAAVAAANSAAIRGPSDVKLAEEGVFHLPEGAIWIPRAQADRYMQAVGHRPDSSLLGIVSGETAKHGWMAPVRLTNEGYVKDEDAKDLDPAKLLASLREGAEESNKSRVARGFSPLILDEWLQAPVYDPETKRLVWALPVRTENDPSPTINYNTRALGRHGYLSLNLLTDKEHFEAEKGTAVALLKRIDYAPGHRYADFNPSADKVAAYGLAALVGAVALKKLGLVAIIGAFLLKFAKVGIIAVIGGFAAIKAFFGRRSRQ